MVKKILTLILTLFTLFFAPAVALAQQTPSTTSANPVNNTYNIPTTIPSTSPLYTDLLIHNIFHTFSCLAKGSSIIGQPCLTYQVTKDTQGKIQSFPVLSQADFSGGALGVASGLIAGLYQNPPVKTTDYLASVGQGLGIVKEASAQEGSGAGVLSPIISLWQVSRNIAYLVMVIIFVVIGVMVMFRNKINPQTVVTAQAALPGLVVGLILITFSYFLAGLIADTAFVGTNLVGAYFSAVKGKADNPQNLVKDINNKSVVRVFSQFSGIIDQAKASQLLDDIWPDLNGSARRVLTMLAVFLTAQTTQQATELVRAIPTFGDALQALIVSSAAAGTVANPTGMIGFALEFIATAVLLYTLFKLLLRLVNNYLSIIFLTISAPFQFLFSALPGRQGIATGWIMNMISNVLAFPAVLAVLYFATFLLGKDFEPFRVTSFNTLPESGLVATAHAQGIDVAANSTFPLFGGLDLTFVRIILAFGALVALPAIPDVIQKAVGAASQAGQILGQEISGGIRTGQGYYGQFTSGVGTGSGQLAKARSLFDTPHYTITDYKEGKPQYELSKYHSSAGGLAKFNIWRKKTFGPPEH